MTVRGYAQGVGRMRGIATLLALLAMTGAGMRYNVDLRGRSLVVKL